MLFPIPRKEHKSAKACLLLAQFILTIVPKTRLIHIQDLWKLIHLVLPRNPRIMKEILKEILRKMLRGGHSTGIPGFTNSTKMSCESIRADNSTRRRNSMNTWGRDNCTQTELSRRTLRQLEKVLEDREKEKRKWESETVPALVDDKSEPVLHHESDDNSSTTYSESDSLSSAFRRSALNLKRGTD